MNVTFINNKIRTQSGVFHAHMLALMRQIDRERHTIHFINFHPGEETEEVKEVVRGEIYSLKFSALFKIIRLLKASDLVYCRN